MKKHMLVSFVILLFTQLSMATKVWDANGNQAINNWISAMYNKGVSGDLATILTTCQNSPADQCVVQVLANGGVHASATDARSHFTARFQGANAPFTACHFYPTDPNNMNVKTLSGATCYYPDHSSRYFKQ